GEAEQEPRAREEDEGRSTSGALQERAGPELRKSVERPPQLAQRPRAKNRFGALRELLDRQPAADEVLPQRGGCHLALLIAGQLHAPESVRGGPRPRSEPIHPGGM